MDKREQLIEDAAKAMYEAPDPGDDTVCPWPPSHPTDREWWLSRADVALAVFEGAGSFLPVASDVQEIAHTDDERAKGEPTDAQADAARIAFHEFCFGPNEPLSDRDLGIGRQAWKVALRAAAETGGER